VHCAIKELNKNQFVEYFECIKNFLEKLLKIFSYPHSPKVSVHTQMISLSSAQHWNMYDVTIVTETLVLLCCTFLTRHAVLSL